MPYRSAEHRREYSREYYRRNRLKLIRGQKKYYQEHREELLDQQKQFRTANKKVYNKKARERLLKVYWTNDDLRQRTLERQRKYYWKRVISNLKGN